MMYHLQRLLLGLGLLMPLAAAAQPTAGEDQIPRGVAFSDRITGLTDAALHYTFSPHVVLYRDPDGVQPYIRLSLREQVYVIEDYGPWSKVRTLDGANGYVRSDELTNVWIYVSKQKQTVYLYKGVRLIMKMPADLGSNYFADKERQGTMNEPDHWRTPEGVFYVATKNARSKYYKALVLNYPNGEDAARGLDQGYISRAEHDAILAAEKAFRPPPMFTRLGGYIEIHGDGTGARSNWTQGCIAVRNQHMDTLWPYVHVGTPVLVEY